MKNVHVRSRLLLGTFFSFFFPSTTFCKQAQQHRQWQKKKNHRSFIIFDEIYIFSLKNGSVITFHSSALEWEVEGLSAELWIEYSPETGNDCVGKIYSSYLKTCVLFGKCSRGKIESLNEILHLSSHSSFAYFHTEMRQTFHHSKERKALAKAFFFFLHSSRRTKTLIIINAN